MLKGLWWTKQLQGLIVEKSIQNFLVIYKIIIQNDRMGSPFYISVLLKVDFRSSPLFFYGNNIRMQL